MTLGCNLAAAVVFAPMLAWGRPVADWTLIWQPMLIAIAFFGGQMLVVMAVQTGDVSIATPVLGLKIFIVAALVRLWLGVAITTGVWAGAVMAVVAIGCLSVSRRDPVSQTSPKTVWPTVMFAAGAAACYALFDVAIQRYAPGWSVQTLLPIAMGLSAVLTLGLLPWCRLPAGTSPNVMRALVFGAVLTSVQSVFLTYAIGTWGNAAAVNIVYSIRGLLSVLLAATIGAALGLSEGHAPAVVWRWRAVGAVLITAAIGVALI